MPVKTPEPIRLSAQDARRLAITAQRLTGERPEPTQAGLMELMASLRCLQLDPIDIVARSPLLVLWSRLGDYDPALLEEALWQERTLFEYWAHAASIVLLEDWPIHRWYMLRQGSGGWRPQSQAWIEANAELRAYILERLGQAGPLAAAEIGEDAVDQQRRDYGWKSGRMVNEMLDYLWFEGEVLVAGRRGRTRMWELAHRFLPPHVDLDIKPTQESVIPRAVELALQALGVGTPKHIRQHFTRFRYPGLAGAIRGLVREGKLLPAQIVDGDDVWPGDWYIHAASAPLLQRLQNGDWRPRTTLLSPFDNLICDRDRTELLFDFFYRLEIYVPKAKRQYGYYVLPLLHGDRLVGRVDPRYNRGEKRLLLQNVYAEPWAQQDEATGYAVAQAIEQLARFLGAEEVVFETPAPGAWRAAMPGPG